MRTRLNYPLIALFTLVLATLATAKEYGVVDNAQLFSPGAVAKAEQTASTLKEKFKVDFLLETFPQIPDEMRSSYNSASADQFFQNWMVSRAKANAVDGAYVLICREPFYLRAGVGNDSIQKGFLAAADRDRLTRLMSERLRERKMDEALIEGANYVHETVSRNAGQRSGAAVPPPTNTTPRKPGFFSGNFSCFWIGLAVIGVFLLIRMFTRRSAQAAGYGPGGYGPPPPPGYGPPQGQPGYPGAYGGAGGGFGRGMLGGLLGGMAGGWLYDKVSGRGNQAYGAPPPDAGAGAGPLEAPHDTDFSGSGGFIDSPNVESSDFGGGGDLGGGDSGGGGGDF